MCENKSLMWSTDAVEQAKISINKMKPILFNTEMVKAILDGRKTVTRRIIKGISTVAEFQGWLLDSTIQEDAKDIGKAAFKVNENSEKMGCAFAKPKYEIGDILYVRETWQCINPYSDKEYVYKAGCDDAYASDISKWHPSIHMPKEAARIFLKITDVRVEKLQDMKISNIEKEGTNLDGLTNGAEKIYAFSQLWDSTVKESDAKIYGFDANPWVWVIEFERISKEDAYAERN